MRRTRSAWSAALGVAAAVVVGLGAAAMSVRPRQPVLRLRNGAELRLVGVSYGTEHRVLEGNGWQRLALRILPPASSTPRPAAAPPYLLNIWQEPGRLGGSALGATTPEERLVVWLRASVSLSPR